MRIPRKALAVAAPIAFLIALAGRSGDGSATASAAPNPTPYGSPPDTLGKQEAYDVAGFVLTHARPQFYESRLIAFPPVPARDF